MQVPTLVVECCDVKALLDLDGLALGVTSRLHLDHIVGLLLLCGVEVAAESDFLVLFECIDFVPACQVEGVSLESALNQVVEGGTYDIADDTASQQELVLGEGYRVEVGHRTQAAGDQGNQDLQVRVLVILSEALLFEELKISVMAEITYEDTLIIDAALELERVVLVDGHFCDHILIYEGRLGLCLGGGRLCSSLVLLLLRLLFRHFIINY